MLDGAYSDGSVHILCKLAETCKAVLKHSVVGACLPVSKTCLCPVASGSVESAKATEPAFLDCHALLRLFASLCVLFVYAFHLQQAVSC